MVNDALQEMARNVDAFALERCVRCGTVHRNHERGEG